MVVAIVIGTLFNYSSKQLVGIIFKELYSSFEQLFKMYNMGFKLLYFGSPPQKCNYILTLNSFQYTIVDIKCNLCSDFL